MARTSGDTGPLPDALPLRCDPHKGNQMAEDPIEIEVTVQGHFPPAKGQRSIFNVLSNRHPRLIALLNEAHRVRSLKKFHGFGGVPLRMDVEVRVPSGLAHGDGTNYLGGIADALEDKTAWMLAAKNPLLTLGHLRYVGLYDNDRQLRHIVYQEVEGELGYTIRLRALGPQSPVLPDP